jgi:hypothetical protein
MSRGISAHTCFRPMDQTPLKRAPGLQYPQVQATGVGRRITIVVAIRIRRGVTETKTDGRARQGIAPATVAAAPTPGPTSAAPASTGPSVRRPSPAGHRPTFPTARRQYRRGSHPFHRGKPTAPPRKPPPKPPPRKPPPLKPPAAAEAAARKIARPPAQARSARQQSDGSKCSENLGAHQTLLFSRVRSE